jgi:hypothetical protein
MKCAHKVAWRWLGFRLTLRCAYRWGHDGDHAFVRFARLDRP